MEYRGAVENTAHGRVAVRVKEEIASAVELKMFADAADLAMT